MSALPYREITTKSVDEFFEELNPLKRGTTLKSSLIYRGQENSEWPLTASVFRIFSERKIKLNIYDKINFEMASLFHFAKSLGGINLFDQRCQNVTTWLESNIEKNNVDCLDDWPAKDALELMALAQHSGIPTRLLDWTYNPYIAAHFAAHSSILSEKRSDKLAVWCYDNSYTIDARKEIQPGDFATNVYRLEPPFWGSNPNAVAQSGCFLFLKNIHDGRSFDLVSQLIINNKAENNHFIKITVPSSECEKILKYCKYFGVTRSNLFRTYEGCAEEVRELFDFMFLKLSGNKD